MRVRFLTSQPPARLAATAAALIAFAAVFLRGANNAFVSDDWVFLYSVAHARSPAEILALLRFDTAWFARPTHWLATIALYHATGLSALAYHGFSIAMHLANAALVFVLWRELLLREFDQRESFWLALAAAVFFAFNHHHHETVFWYSSINELLSAFFRLTTLLLLWKGVARPGQPRLLLLLAAGATALLALLSKESAVMLVAEAALLLGYELATREDRAGRSIKYHAAAVGSLAAITALWALAYVSSSTATSGASVVHRSGLTVLSTSVLGWVFRSEHVFARCYVPTQLPGSITLMRLVPVFAVVLALVALRRRRLSVIVAVLWTLIAIAPVVATTSVNDVVQRVPVLLREAGISEGRYYYYPVALAGALLVVVAGWAAAEARRLGPRFLSPALAIGGAGALILHATIQARQLVEHEADWALAGTTAERLVSSTLEAIPNVTPLGVLCLNGVPDNYNGKFVFRNGAKEALYLSYAREDFGIAINERRESHLCTWSAAWDSNVSTVTSQRSAH
jgi:hypothetical protein